MSRSNSDIRVTPSVLDRLIDLDPQESREAPKSRSAGLQDLKASVRRDLEWLLNTRCHLNDDDNQLDEAKRSIAFYGLPDIMGMNAKNNAEQTRLTKSLETAIRIFEPRFMNLKVTMDPVEHADRHLRFRIEANLDIEPTPEPIVFDTMLELGSGEFSMS
ncbi:MAG TPA: type VI secretion system baseplate subunit TssE [Pyrinomonadaceae bacterium]|jgi:type VI secretion system protein ImpF|nr:type VI secretion system baseplate subunit TssE [Chloracidobacterium sp.]MBP9935485.1 type VI secretion system baseplate subunit TssE [Pyrinomonadaceae bacterium]MBK7801900.1 type VI secretion system baseplate subunit TssE [Chloracidobacterium sp.]MBK9437957.1 type VI secretion system baseplate subunit TssE [Chloracidobacterium sp.]MBK9765613.1 type VI secretion system baseplate subunit TssE [Chloracidobacterium sp.]